MRGEALIGAVFSVRQTVGATSSSAKFQAGASSYGYGKPDARPALSARLRGPTTRDVGGAVSQGKIASEGAMADQQKAEKKISEKETTTKKVKAGEAKAAEPAAEHAAEVVSPPAATVSVALRKKSMKRGKLLSKNKHRLPRRQKKAQLKGVARLHLK